MLISWNLHKKSSEVSIKTPSTIATFSFIGQVTKHTTVKWSIQEILKLCLVTWPMNESEVRVDLLTAFLT